MLVVIIVPLREFVSYVIIYVFVTMYIFSRHSWRIIFWRARECVCVRAGLTTLHVWVYFKIMIYSIVCTTIFVFRPT
jgi:hypothetical protein